MPSNDADYTLQLQRRLAALVQEANRINDSCRTALVDLRLGLEAVRRLRSGVLTHLGPEGLRILNEEAQAAEHEKKALPRYIVKGFRVLPSEDEVSEGFFVECAEDFVFGADTMVELNKQVAQYEAAFSAALGKKVFVHSVRVFDTEEGA